MDTTTGNLARVAGASKRFVTRLLAVGENRLDLLVVELQEERDRGVRVLLLALGAAVCALLAGVTLTAAIVILFWEHSPLAALLVLTSLYIAAAAALYANIMRIRRDWRTLPETLEQLRKDRECLERSLS